MSFPFHNLLCSHYKKSNPIPLRETQIVDHTLSTQQFLNLQGVS